jgi:hypothetical protein
LRRDGLDVVLRVAIHAIGTLAGGIDEMASVDLG